MLEIRSRLDDVALADLAVELEREPVLELDWPRELDGARGTREFSPDFSSSEPSRLMGLTQREAEVLLGVAQGKSNGEIATIIGTAENTVKTHGRSVVRRD